MPWTLSHPAAVLPLRRFSPRPLDFPALVIGSMTPDVGYYINRFDLTNFAHTLPGSFLACLPTGLVMLLIFYLFCRPFCYALPAPHRQALLPLCPGWPAGMMTCILILVSLLLGAWTHNFWDAFTHEHGWFVDRIPFLQQPVFHIRSTTIQTFLFLQELSTVVGLVIIVLAYWRWLRRTRLNSVPESSSDGWRYLFWLSVLVLSFGLAFPAAVYFAIGTGLRDFLFVRSLIFRTAIYASPISVLLILLGTSVAYARRDREIPARLR